MNRRNLLPPAVLWIFGWTCLLAGVPLVGAQEFVIESQMFVGDSTAPVTHNRTVFVDGLVFDFQVPVEADQKPSEIVIFDPRKRSLFLLDLQREVELELQDLRLLKLLDGMRKELLSDDETKFLVEDAFEEKVDFDERQVELTSRLITYRFQGSPPQDESILPRYYEFLNSFTQLQVSDPRKIPPFARIRLNQSIRRVGWLPDRVDISVRPNVFFPQPFQAHMKHRTTMGLTPADRERVVAAKQKWRAYTVVGLAEYRQLKPVKAKLELPFTKGTNRDVQRK